MSDYEQEQDIVKVLNKRINYDEIQKNFSFSYNSKSYNSLPTGSLQLSQIAFANDTEGGDGGNDFKKCEQGNVSFFPAHGAIACLYCGDCLAHWVFPTYDGDCKLFNK